MRVHFIGDKGVSMRTLRTITARLGHETSGSDLTTGGHDPNNVKGANLVVFTGAISADNPELSAARENGVPTIERSEYLAAIAASFGRVIAIAGSHGKTTATALTAAATACLNPTVHIGGEYAGGDGNEYFITEACEFRRSFLMLAPDVGVILNADLDHTDCYKTEAEAVEAFLAFGRRCGKLCVNGDDPRLGIDHPDKITFGLGENCDVRAVGLCADGENRYSFSLFCLGVNMGRLELSLVGRHNVYNALAAASVALGEGVSMSEIARAFVGFKGVARRMETLGYVRGARVIADYAHHPTEIRALIASLRPRARLIVVFEPHTYSRTRDLFDKFATCFRGADEVVFLPVFAAREKTGEVTSVDLYNAVSKIMPARYFGSYAEAENYLFGEVGEGDIVVFAGAGTIYSAAADFAKKDRSEQTTP